ncbi:cation:proton antiporter [Gimesia aquarii]|uniref:Glutathione-regulated potassium-efflux system protein KefC n=1 Tax=Gimesia aquarii TaxID=2527964 RepID=A0A517W042_9PLAN|nr:cation:proton antiporter [Gimesia aquarii]QDT98619.1 Glutathione-regulated potassium-efflux system protein KefC [Gimesia aquarii]
MTQSLIYDLLTILAAGLIASLVCRWLRASVLIGYLIAGALLGQGVLGWVLDKNHQLEHFAEAGVFLLLFSIGLEFHLDDLKRLGFKLIIGGAVQMTLVAIPVAAVLLWLSISWQSAVLIAAAVTFSSTVLVFKALSERGHSEQSHGRRAIGILLFQDAALIPLLLLVPLLTGTGQAARLTDYIMLALTSILFVVAVAVLRYLLSKWVIPMFARYRSPELVILFTVVSLGAVTLAAYSVGLPPAVGAFAAGLIFNGNRWTKQIDALVLPFRETFAAIFFVGLGLIFDPRLILEKPVEMLLVLVGVIIIKTVAGTIALKLTGLPIRQAFGMGISLAHVGEFAFVLVLLGLESGVLTNVDYQNVVAIAVGSLIVTPPLMRFGLRFVHSEDAENENEHILDTVSSESTRATIIGAGPIGRQLASQLEIKGNDVCLIDFSSINLHPFAQEGFRTVAGDATQSSTLELAGVSDSVLTAVCVPDDETAIRIVRAIRRLNRTGKLIVRCRYQTNVEKLKQAGADRVVSEEAVASIALMRTLTNFGESPD